MPRLFTTQQTPPPALAAAAISGLRGSAQRAHLPIGTQTLLLSHLINTCCLPDSCARPPRANTKTQPFSVLGSTGSIGTQTLDIIEEFPDKFKLVALAAGSNVELLAEQVCVL